MPELFVRNESGEFVPAPKEEKPPAPAVIAQPDWVKELAGIVKDLSGGVARIKEKEEEINEKLAAYKELAKKGFPLPSSDSTIPEHVKQIPEVLSRVKLAIQGKELMNKRFYPKYNIVSEEVRKEIAEYMCLFLKAGIDRNPRAVTEFWDRYRGQFAAEGKTSIGDSGNTFPVTDIIEAEVLAFAREQSVALQYARVVPMTGEKQSYPAENSSASVAWGNTTAKSDPTVTDVELAAEELSAYTEVKNTTLDDSPSDIVSWIFSNMSEAVGLELDNVLFNGDGSSTYGSVSGVFLTAGYSVTLASGSTAFSQVSAAKLSEMISKLDGLKKMGARFFMHGQVLHFVRSLTDDNNRPIFMETVGSSIPPSIWGFPYTEAVKCPSTSAADTYYILFGNLRYFFVGRRQGVMSLQANPWESWTTNRTCFKIYSRWGLKTALANGLVRLATAAS